MIDDRYQATDDSNKEYNEFLLGTEKAKLRDRILLSPYTKFLLPSLLVAFFVPVIVYLFMINPYVTESTFSSTTCNLRDEYRVDCLPGRKNTTQNICTELLCCWDDENNFCYHTVPSRHGFTPYSGIYYEGVKLIPRETKSPLGSLNVDEVYLDIKSVDDNHLEISLEKSIEVSRIKRRGLKSFLNIEYEDLYEEDNVTQRLLYFLPRDVRRRTVEIELDISSNLKAYVHYPEFSVTVTRSGGGLENSILSTARGPFILTETYWELTLYLTNGSIYGLNDLRLNGTTNFIYNNENGTITPAFLAISPNGQGAAYYIDYKGPLEIQVLNASNLIILRGMGLPENMSLHVFSGPTPLEAVKQLTLALSSATSNPSFSFKNDYNHGLHVCPNGIFNSTEESLEELNETVSSLDKLNVVWDSHCINENLAPVLNHDLTKEDLEFVKTAKNYLENIGRHFSPHLSPMILADEKILHTELDNSMLLLSNGSIAYTGLYQYKNVVYPDWHSSDVKTATSSYLEDYLIDIGSPGSLWVRDAWPKDESYSSNITDVDFSVFDYMPEILENLMNNSTIPYDLITTSGNSHHLTHNSYAQEFRLFINSSVNTVNFLGPPGENGNTSWSGLRRAVRSAIGSGIVGQLPPPIYICGTGEFDVTIHDELCIRWYQAAVTWPYIISLADRLPGKSLLSTTASFNAAKALRLRASLATYQRTLIAGFAVRGTPLLAPTSLYYPNDTTLTNSEDQFMWGEAILVGLVTLPRVSQVPMRLPGNISWLHLMGGAEALPLINGTTPVTATLGQIITLVRPGHVVPIHKEVGTTTRETISNNVTLSANLNCEYEENCSAYGEIYYGYKSGEFLTIKINRTHLTIGNINGVNNYACNNNNNNNNENDDNSQNGNTKQMYQATYIKTVELLGNLSYEVDTELCDIKLNNVDISLA